MELWKVTKDHNRNFKEKTKKLIAKMNRFTIKFEAKHKHLNHKNY